MMWRGIDMLRLKIQKEPYWLELGYGVKVKVKPCTSAVFYEAKAYMNNKISQKIQQHKEAKEVGADVSDFLDLNNPKIREAFADEHLTIGMALAGILEWDGVLEAENDETAPVCEQKIEELFSNFWLIAENFRNQYCGIREILEAEKNGLTPDANGISAKGETIAKGVRKNINSARLKNAST